MNGCELRKTKVQVNLNSGKEPCWAHIKLRTNDFIFSILSKRLQCFIPKFQLYPLA